MLGDDIGRMSSALADKGRFLMLKLSAQSRATARKPSCTLCGEEVLADEVAQCG